MNARDLLRPLGLAAVVALAVPHGPAQSQTCSDPAARDLLAASYLDSAINPPIGEDLDFLQSDGGFPNIMVLFDSSASMRRLPPDGPGRIGAVAPSLPPGVLVSDPARNPPATSTARIVGCGLDTESGNTTTGIMGSQTMQGLMLRRFNTPCGTAVTAGRIGAEYAGHSVNYAAEMNTCPYYTSSNNQAYVAAPAAAGFDPDFYNNAGPTDVTRNGKPVFFGKDLVFHDTVATEPALAYDAASPFKHNFGDGWSDTAVNPFKASTNAPGSIAEFCAAQGTATQGGQTHEAICNACLRTRGWYYDGFLLDTTEDGVTYRYPSLWYTGNYLNFFPPKFLAARKVVKDVIAVQSSVRMALARFDAAGTTGASVFQDFNPPCSMGDTSSFDNNRGSYVSALNSSNNLTFEGGAPLANALFDVGRYYHTPALPWFGNAWNGTNSPSNANQLSVCSSCQVSTVIVLTDGVPNVNDGSTLPPSATTAGDAGSGKYAGDVTTGIQGITAADCPTCAAFSGTDAYLNNLPKVAWYLNNMDLRQNTESTVDCNRMGGKQTLQTYTVGFGTAQLATANAVLRNTAKAGGGIFVGAENPAKLKEGLNDVLRAISTRATSFSVASVSTLQSTSGRAVIVPRFQPSKDALWEGHLYRYDLYSEFVNRCEPRGVGDLDCDGQCVSTFLADNGGSDTVTSLVSEDGAGTLVRNEPATVPLCSQAPACQTGSCATAPGNVAARPFWDAGAALATRSWSSRNVWTALDSDGDGDIDGSDQMVRVSTANAGLLVPYLALGTGADGASVCADVAALLADAGNGARATAISGTDAASKLECAKTIVRYVLGADVFNSKANAAYPPSDEETLWDRDFKLGDIFHSSPVVVDPPLPRSGVICRNGLSNQCISSLWGTPTLDGDAGYDAYANSTDYKDRRKIVLVGANDGLLHAFNGGTWHAHADDPYTTAVNESGLPFNGYYDRGDATELWAFLPPDLIPKLPLLMSSSHHYFVDGTAMVRDVWVDGTSNEVGSGTADDKKQGGEFHTVAVVGERRGGTRYFALDLTDASEAAADAATAPRLLWMYPQPGDRRSLEMGSTYTDFLPSAPPIGPVRIAAQGDAIADVTPEMVVDGQERPVPYRERWVALLSGGFDPQYLRGRGVFMVDVWTGKELFDFSYPRTPTGGTDPREALRFPIAAPAGMVPWGRAVHRASTETNDRFFDTATFGDTGGQLWVVRFSDPGELNADGKVTNWFGARVFQMGARGNCTLCAAQPFFHITANMPLPTNAMLRVFAGTGDRYNLLDLDGGTCGPDNIRACVMRGCTVTLSTDSNFLQAGQGKDAAGLSNGACSAAGTLTGPRAYSDAGVCGAGGRARIEITGCPGALSTTKDLEASCEATADGYRCTQVRSSGGAPLAISPTTAPINVGNWYLSLRVFDDGSRPIFSTASGAQRYDASRLWINQTGMTTSTVSGSIKVMPASVDRPTNTATAMDDGWAIRYDHEGDVAIGNATYTVAWQDERTSSGTAVGEGLITWNTTQPAKSVRSTSTVAGGCRASKCTETGRRVAYHYAADPETGGPVEGFGWLRAIKSAKLVPAQADQTTVFVNAKGQVAVGLTAVNPESGATNVGMGEPIDPFTDMGTVEVSRELHECRHAPEGTAPVCR